MKPLIDRPGKAMALSTPGCWSVISLIRRITSSVRSSVAPSGKLGEADEILLVLPRHEAARHGAEKNDGHADEDEIDRPS